jgi:hypothetical protein
MSLVALQGTEWSWFDATSTFFAARRECGGSDRILAGHPLGGACDLDGKWETRSPLANASWPEWKASFRATLSKVKGFD